MIQQQGQDELIVGVPSAGPLLDHRSHLRACFGNLLAPGREETIEGSRCIDWHVEGQQRLSPTDPRHSETVAQLSRGVARARQLASFSDRHKTNCSRQAAIHCTTRKRDECWCTHSLGGRYKF